MIIEMILGCSFVLLFILICIISKDIIKIKNEQRELLKIILDNKLDIKKLFKMFEIQINLNDEVMLLIDKICGKQDEPKKCLKEQKMNK